MTVVARLLTVSVLAVTGLGCSYRRAPADGAAGGTTGDANGGDHAQSGGAGGGSPDGSAADEPDDMPAADVASDAPASNSDAGVQTLANGIPCATNAQCASNQCVDGVCCESACLGQCQACAESNLAGKCVTVVGAPRGTTRTACAGQGPCASRCDGSDAVACHNPGIEVQCAPPSCLNGTATVASVCDRAGGCTAVTSVACASNACADGMQCSGGCGPTHPCAPDAYCEPTTKACLPLKTSGVGCTSDQECASLACTDHVCCTSRCSGQCQSCAETGMVGQCVTIAGTPRGTTRQPCAGAGTCASRCDGTDSTQCKYPGSATQCASASCSAGVSTAATVCNGAGSCTPAVATACASNQCLNGTQCSSGCSVALPCAMGQYCTVATSACLPLKATAAPCASDVECSSNACTDGVCCDSRCAGQCQACAESNMVGRCVTVSGLPRGSLRSACVGTGTCASRCDGTNAAQCQYPGSGLQCVGPTCAAGIAKGASVCNGAGACTVPTSTPCSSNQCADNTQCSGGCSAAQPCAAGQYCDPTSKACLPLKINGTACSIDLECSSLACTDGVCCNLRCGGQCEACAEAGSIGTCVAVKGAPRGNTRLACAGTRDVCRGTCGGITRTQCTFNGATTQCLAPSCGNGILTTASVCNGLGDCTAQTTTPCHSTQCASTMTCLDSCSATAPCSAGFYCDAVGVCHPQIGAGVCQTDAQCFSGHCADGVCCNQACGGCSACNLAGSSGTCVSRITEYSTVLGASFESAPITVGSDNNLWIVEEIGSYIGRITTVGVLTEFKIVNLERGTLVNGPDGRLWFDDTTDDPSNLILRVNTSGVQLAGVPPQLGNFGLGRMFADSGGVWAVQADESVAAPPQHQLILLDAGVKVVRTVQVPVVGGDMAHGSDGNLWFVSTLGVSRVNANNTVTSFPVAGINLQSGIAATPDGFIWFTESATNKIGKINVTGGSFSELTIPTPGSAPGKMLAGPGGSVWFIEATPPKLARIQANGTILECPIGGLGPGELTAGPDGNVWVAGNGTPIRIDRFTP